MGLGQGRSNLLLMSYGSSTILRMVNVHQNMMQIMGWDRFIDARLKQRPDSDGENVG